MNQAQRDQLSELLQHAAEFLDIPDDIHDEAVAKYEDVGHWLEDQDQEQGRKEPKVYSQGSFRLGTVIRPLSDKDEYDIDLVYERDLKTTSTTQEQLKSDAGDHLKGYVRDREEGFADAPTLKEGRRCWTLEYDDRFHMDVLPAIPDEEGRKDKTPCAATKLHVTDQKLREWQHSNPIGYAEWFKERMKPRFLEKRAALAASMKRAAEEVPEYKVKTPLQRAVQLLKRHRDLYFQNDLDDKPASIIITTLAARAYDNQADLLDALVAMVRDMPKFIIRRNGEPWVENPVNDKENFADKWKDNPHSEMKLRAWLAVVQSDLDGALKQTGIDKVAASLGMHLGPNTMTKAAAALGRNLLQQRQSGQLKMAAGSGAIGTTGNLKVKDHTFYGDVAEAEDN